MGSTVGARMSQGTVEGTGSTIDIELEFTPSSVFVMNIDDPGSLWWVASMADASGLKNDGAGTMSLITSAGITPVRSTVMETDLPGFQIGADTDINVSAQTMHWIAWE
ncbi:MAG: hypothetical protein KAS32_19600 [Candidatus Peribacteraceae bacterium]|nr:hypothetical protein [Candidatus Peribacteraceae bacterium]